MEMTHSDNNAVANTGNVALSVFTAGDDWEDFIQRLQQFFETNAIGEDRQVAILLTCISEDVHGILRNLCHPVRPITKTLAELVTLLDKEYKPKVSTYRKRIEFDQLRQNEEDVIEWYHKVKEVASICEFGEYLDFRVKDKFVTGMKPGPILDGLCEEETSVILSELLEVALQKEATFGNAGATMDIVEDIKSENIDDDYQQVGCVHFTNVPNQNSCGVKLIILFYIVEKQGFLGFILNNQTTLIDRLREEIPRQSTSYPHAATEEIESKLEDLHHSIDIKDFSIPEETNRKKFLCPICGYKSALEATLNIHLQTHAKEKSFACGICNHKFGSETNLNIHVITTHSAEKHLRVQYKKKQNTCGTSSYKCTPKPIVERHLRTRQPEKLFTCEVCDFKSVRRNTLRIHLRTHTGEKPYSCEICDRKFSGRGNWINHVRTHTGEKPFTCAVCNYKCALKRNLVTHLKNHTGEKPFACHLCDFRSALKTNLQVHLKIHSGEKPFMCSFCDYRCLRKISLKVHLRSHTE